MVDLVARDVTRGKLLVDACWVGNLDPSFLPPSILLVVVGTPLLVGLDALIETYRLRRIEVHREFAVRLVRPQELQELRGLILVFRVLEHHVTAEAERVYWLFELRSCGERHCRHLVCSSNIGRRRDDVAEEV